MKAKITKFLTSMIFSFIVGTIGIILIIMNGGYWLMLGIFLWTWSNNISIRDTVKEIIDFQKKHL